jgi:hypothetical protein
LRIGSRRKALQMALQIAGAITGTVGRQCPSAWKARVTTEANEKQLEQ